MHKVLTLENGIKVLNKIVFFNICQCEAAFKNGTLND